ncbi:MAG: hypothetical protein AAFZ52_19580, partial [Bacteroidota bacterium]
MMRLSLFLYLLCTGTIHAQITFRPGYLIDAAGTVATIDLRVPGWHNNPTDIRYRETTGELITVPVEQIQEFGLRDSSARYQRFTVAIDQSLDDPARLSTSPEPEFREETVLLRTLVDGAADLFFWERDNQRRYFFRVGDGPVEQLVFRRFRVGQKFIETDDRFRKQLSGNLK